MSVKPRYLADVNVLFSLLWPRHQHHAEAQAWFASQGHTGWATNSITQLGALRLLTNPTVVRGVVPPASAISTLSAATGHPNHEFWPLATPVTRLVAGVGPNLTGHRQWTDLLLLRQAIENGGKLVTFDSAFRQLAGPHASANLVVLG